VLKAKLAPADEPPPPLHPEMARLYRIRIAGLAKALRHSESRAEATQVLRGLVDTSAD
jgi:site-specific DNA recombinase